MSILTTGIGLIITYLILSLIASGIHETIAGWFALRGKFLGRALDNMLTNTSLDTAAQAADKALLHAFKGHAHFQNLLKGESQTHPSYLRAKTFSSILMHLLDGTDAKTLQASIGNMQEGKLKKFLTDSLQEADNDLGKFRTKLEDWYDEVMAATSGWYKRYTHNVLIGIGLLLGAYFNADSLVMYQKMTSSNNASLQTQQIVALAQDLLSNTLDTSFTTHSRGAASTLAQVQAGADSTTAANKLDSLLVAQNEALLNQTQSIVAELQANSSPLGLGWTHSDINQLKRWNLGFLTMKLLGLFVTAMAISLGAPFWFDLLKRFMNIRNAGTQINAASKTSSNG